MPMLEVMRRRLRALVKLLAKTKQVIVYTDIVDEIGELKEIDLHRVAVGVDADRFRVRPASTCKPTSTMSPCKKCAATASSPQAT